MENIKCIFCKKEDSRIAVEENGYTGQKCQQCGLIYISPRPSHAEIIHLYGHDAAHIPAEAHISSQFKKRLYARHNLSIITSLVNSGTILEIGAGAGYFLDEARKLGFEPYGIEFNPLQAQFIRNELGLPCEESALTSSSFGNKKFDTVYHCDVISHFFDPISEFREIHEKMKEGGWLIFETGNFAEVRQEYYKYIQRFQYPDHLFFFSINNLIDLLDETGFEFIRVYRYSILPQLAVTKVFLGLKNFAARLNRRERNTDADDKKRNLSGSYRQSPSKKSGTKKFKRMGWDCLSYFNYFLRYKIGYIIPKAGRPQTVIVVAKKKMK